MSKVYFYKLDGTNMQDKIRVVLLCHFSNEAIRSELPLSKMRIKNVIQKIRGKEAFKYSDIAIWNNELFNELEKIEKEIEVHVVAPHMGLKPKLVELEQNGIYYHIFKSDDDGLLTIARNKLFGCDGIKKYKYNCKIVKRLVSNIKPDLVNLIGSENPYYSITALGLNNIPIYLTCQTVYTNPDRKLFSNDINKMCWDAELALHNKIKYFGCAGKMHRDLVLRNNPEAIIFKHTFPVSIPKKSAMKTKNYDFVFYSVRLSNKKGILDAIEAINIVRNSNPDVRLLVIGDCDENIRNEIELLIKKYELTRNIVFHKSFQRHDDLYESIAQCRYAILPIKLDIISSTIIESMALGLPVVTYKTSGTPYLNKDKHCALISDIGDIQGLADNMIKLLNDNDLANMIKKNAREFVDNNYNNERNVRKLIADYRAIIANYKYNTPIPEELLFDVGEFPKYEEL